MSQVALSRAVAATEGSVLVIVSENVKALMSSGGERIYDTVIQNLHTLAFKG